MTDYGKPYQPDLRDLGTAFGLGVLVTLAAVAMFFPGVFE